MNILNMLVVDDDETILDIFQEVMGESDKYRVMVARSGVEALKIVESNSIDICFTDLMMPGMSGIEFSRNLLGLDNTIPIVVMTGFPSADIAIKTIKTGVVDFLVKPFTIEEIKLAITKTLQDRDMFVENMLLRKELKGKKRLVQLNEQLSEKVNDLKTLNIILQQVEWPTTGADIFNLLVKLCSNISDAHASQFYVYDYTTKLPVMTASICTNPIAAELACHDSVQAILRARLHEGIPILIKGVSENSLAGLGIGSMIIIPLKIRGELFGILTSMMLGQSKCFREKDLYYLDFMARRASFFVENFALYENIYEGLFSTLYAFVDAIEARDPYTKQHSSRVTDVAMGVGRILGCNEQQLGVLNFSGQLHDIGKLGVRDSILLKPSRLTFEEKEIIKTHPVIGANIVGRLGLMSEEQDVIRHHHERWDGKGYPDGLKGEAIPLLARIVALADAYDAMANDRAYRRRLCEREILMIIENNAGLQFDKTIAEAFFEFYDTAALGDSDKLVVDLIGDTLSSDIKSPVVLL